MTPLSSALAILFLDFDGCLHPHFPLEDFTDEMNARWAFVPQFEAAVRASERQVQIVISSAWRRGRSLATLSEPFSPDIRERIVGVTPSISGGGFKEGGRLAECLAWLEQNGHTDTPWVAVDDCPEYFASEDRDVALVDCHDKFTERETDLLLQALRDPVAYAQSHRVYGLRRRPRGE